MSAFFDLIIVSAFCLHSIVFFAVDIISAIEFDKTGDHLATGDRGGRVVLFERTDRKGVSMVKSDLCWEPLPFIVV